MGRPVLRLLLVLVLLVLLAPTCKCPPLEATYATGQVRGDGPSSGRKGYS